MNVSIEEYFREHPWFHGVPREELQEAAGLLKPAFFASGSWLMKEGQLAEECFLLLDGQAQVTSRNLVGERVVLSELSAGEMVGEIALMRNDRRGASVQALTEVNALRIDRDAFARLSEISPLFYESLSYTAEIRMIHGILQKASIWSAIPEQELRGLAEITVRKHVEAGETVVLSGEFSNQFFMVLDGKFEMTQAGKRATVLRKGDFFGEVSLLAGVPEENTIVAATDGELMVMAEEEFHSILAYYPPVKQQFTEVLRIRRPDLTVSVSREENVEHEVAVRQTEETSSPVAGRKRDSWMNVLLLSAGAFILLSLLALLLKGNQAVIVASLIVGGAVGPITFVSIIRDAQLLGFQARRLALMFILSAVFAVPLAWVLEQWLLVSEEGPLGSFRVDAAPIVIGVVEELSKLLLVVALLRAKRMRFLMDAIVFGATAGMGFAALESAYYGWMHLEQNSAWQMLAVLWTRTLLSPFGHGTWTAIASAGIWYGLTVHAKRGEAAGSGAVRKWTIAALLVFAAIVLHACWDFQPWSGWGRLLWLTFIGCGGLFLLLLLIRRGGEEERRSLAALNPPRQLRLRQDEAEKQGADILCEACGTYSPRGATYCTRCGQALLLEDAGG
ncbi:cyclic nucleotide-binding domain-containing protein [Cohnella terricola]|nr:cyclic nucleotide-binding domain-containing protein [Cohnella terricola]